MRSMRRTALRADAILLLAAALWGGAFVAQRVAMRHMGPLTFNGLRFALGTIVLIPVVLARSGRLRGRSRSAIVIQPGRSHSCDCNGAGAVDASGSHACGFGPRTAPDECASGATGALAGASGSVGLAAGVTVGLVMFVAATLQQAGLIYTTAGKAGFITGLYVALVPVFGLFIGRRTRAATWVGAGLAVAGLYFLSVVGPLEINPGDALVMGSAIVWAVQVLLIGIYAPRTDPVRLALVQFAVVAVASLVAAAAFEQVTLAAVRAAVSAILYGGVLSVGVAFTLQVVGQRIAPPGHAALVLSLETVFAGLAGYLVLDERLGPRELFGAALMFAGMMVSQVRRVLSDSAPVPGLASGADSR